MTQPQRSPPSAASAWTCTPHRTAPPSGALAPAVLCALAFACAHGLGEPPPVRTRLPDVQALSHGAPTLWQRFEAEEERPRLLILASPTCTDCLHGVSVVKEQVLAKAPPALRAFVVWVPALEDDDRISAAAASGLLPDEVEQYWDEGGRLSRALGGVLQIPPGRGRNEAVGLAWDVYLLYAPRRLADQSPYLWMHQLAQVPPSQAQRLDGRRLRARLDELLPPVRH